VEFFTKIVAPFQLGRLKATFEQRKGKVIWLQFPKNSYVFQGWLLD